ncbi:uncharacterized protein LOC142976834 [Anticarsia gemmatalis]|uniref:uncharacterized protein LOC142976834 n=1 Tax=Anticarsia gemmatalis TaxID=129554 RepID=UPI003F76DA47
MERCLCYIRPGLSYRDVRYYTRRIKSYLPFLAPVALSIFILYLPLGDPRGASDDNNNVILRFLLTTRKALDTFIQETRNFTCELCGLFSDYFKELHAYFEEEICVTLPKTPEPAVVAEAPKPKPAPEPAPKVEEPPPAPAPPMATRTIQIKSPKKTNHICGCSAEGSPDCKKYKNNKSPTKCGAKTASKCGCSKVQIQKKSFFSKFSMRKKHKI